MCGLGPSQTSAHLHLSALRASWNSPGAPDSDPAWIGILSKRAGSEAGAPTPPAVSGQCPDAPSALSWGSLPCGTKPFTYSAQDASACSGSRDRQTMDK